MEKKHFILPLIVIIILALSVQLIRSDYALKHIKNINSFETLQESYNAKIPEGLKKEKFLVIYDSKEKGSNKIKDNLYKVFQNIKKDYEIQDVNSEKAIKDNYEAIIFTFEDLGKLKNMEYFNNYVGKGGKIIFMERPLAGENFSKISKNAGIEKIYGFKDVSGIKMLSNVLIGSTGFLSNTKVILNSSLDLKLSRECQVHINSSDDVPLLWEKKYGQGKFLVFNGTLLNEKSNRGLMTGILSLEKDGFIYPVVNSKLLYIDDFPSPVPEGTDKKIYDAYQRDIPAFYREVWWGDILKSTKKYDLKITGLVIENYNDRVSPPFDKNSNTSRKNLVLFGREIIKNGGEIGIHGYNHQALAPPGYIKQDLGYNSWDSKQHMVDSIKEVVAYTAEAFPSYKLRVYVPPSNILSPEGRDAIKQAMPDLNVISSVFNNNSYEDAYAQDFETAKDGIAEMPRFTSGYERSDEQKWCIYNGVTYIGVFSHFIHPDDVLDYKRNNGKTWRELSKEFEAMLKEVKDKFGWLTSMTASGASQELKKYIDCDPYIQYEGDSINIYCERFRPNYHMFIRTKKQIKNYSGCTLTKADEDVYLINIKDAKCTIKLGSGDK